MGIKEILFITFLIISISMPFFFKQKNIIIEKKNSFPLIEIENGNFKIFNKTLTQQGEFSKLDYLNDNLYKIYNSYISFIDKNSTLKSKIITYKNNNYYFYNAIYKNNEYTYKSKYSIYFNDSKTLKSKSFSFFNKKIEGKGKNLTYKNDIITANDIFYIIKGL